MSLFFVFLLLVCFLLEEKQNIRNINKDFGDEFMEKKVFVFVN